MCNGLPPCKIAANCPPNISIKTYGKILIVSAEGTVFLAKIINTLPIFLDFMDIIDTVRH